MPNSPIIKNEELNCPFCKGGKILVTIMSAYFVDKTSRIAGKSKKVPTFRPERIEVNSGCSQCGKSKNEIKEAIKNGALGLSHEERIERLKKSGIPTRIEG